MLLLVHTIGHNLLVIKWLISLVSSCVMAGADKCRSHWELNHNQLPSVDLACLRYLSCNSCSQYWNENTVYCLSQWWVWCLSDLQIINNPFHPLVHRCFTEVIVESISHIQSVTRDSFSSRIINFFFSCWATEASFYSKTHHDVLNLWRHTLKKPSYLF